jgi:hypothetical protein
MEIVLVFDWIEAAFVRYLVSEQLSERHVEQPVGVNLEKDATRSAA